jgi:ABC-type glycerol-3-phosphate transport system permease component
VSAPAARARPPARTDAAGSRVGTPPRLLSGVVKVILTLLYLIPLLWIVIESLKSDSQSLTAPDALIFTPTLSTFRTIIGQAGGSILLSLEVAAAATAAVMVFGVPAAYALARRTTRRWGRVIAVVLTILLVLQMVPQPMTVIPLYGVLLHWHLLGSAAGLIVADTALVLPFSIVLLRPFALAIPRALYEAAALDGASSVQTFRRIVLPLLRNGIATVAAMVFIIVWGEFIYATNFITQGSRFPVSALLAQQIGEYAANWNRLMALALLTSLPLLVVFLFAQRRLTAGLTLGAVR